MKTEKLYKVTIELSTKEISVFAPTKSEARKRAIDALNQKQASSYIGRSWPDNHLQIYIDEQ